MSVPVPVIDPRTADAVRAALDERVPGYLPQWSAERTTGDAGHALLSVLARYRHIFGQGLNRCPERSRLAFLETLGNSLLPGQAARVPLVFDLLETAPQDVMLPAQSQVAAKLPPRPAALGSDSDAATSAEAPRYFTTRNVSLVRARLAALYSTDPVTDTFADHLGGVASGFAAFDHFTNMSHALYLGHDALFALAGAAEVALSFDMAGERNDRLLALDWEYLSEDGWLALVIEEDTTVRFTRDGRIRLRKTCGPDAKRDTIFGRESYWIRARASDGPATARIVEVSGQGLLLDRAGALLPGDIVTIDGEATATVKSALNRVVELAGELPDLGADLMLRVVDTRPPLSADTHARLGAPPQVDVIRARVGFTKTDLKVDLAFANYAQLDLDNVFYPFGQQPKTFDTFYIASADSFSRRGAEVTIEFTFKQPGDAGSSGIALAYEYYDGRQWKSLSPSLPTRLVDLTEGLTQAGSITFVAPEDWAETKVNGQKKFWLRLRIDGGDYGEPIKLTVVNDSNGNPVVSAVDSSLEPPVVASLAVSYTYFTNSQLLDHCVAFNNFVFRDHSEDCRWTRRPFEPFLHSEDRDPALNLGYDAKLPAGLVSLFVDLPENDQAVVAPSSFIWEYRTAEAWAELTVLDETAGLKRQGMIQFVGPSDAYPTEGRGGSLYRLRARLKPGERSEAAWVRGLWMNAVWGTQGERVTREIVGRSDGNPEQVLMVPPQRVPVLAGELVEVREWSGRGPGWRTTVEGIPETDLRFDRDPVTREPRAVWVRWHGREHLLESAAGDRHYALERTRGRLQFGDDVRGRIPPGGAPVALSFTTGIGVAGNVPPHTITELRTGVAYLRGVTNPLAAEGGSAPEGANAVVARATQRIRHRGRAVATDDYVWLAHEASPAVARARCLAVTGVEGRTQPGCVTLVVVPHGSERQPVPSAGLRRRVREFVAAACAPTVARTLRVVSPHYVEVGVVAHIVLANADLAVAVESALREVLDSWLHPITGGDEGDGWPFGAVLCLSRIAAKIEATLGVDYATRVALRADGGCEGDVLTLPPDALPCAGLHEIKIELPS